MSCLRFRRDIERIALGEDLADWGALSAHFRECARCASHHRRVVTAVRLSHGDRTQPAPEELAAVGAAVVRAATASGRSRWRGGLLPLGGALAGALTLLLVLTSSPRPSDGEVQVRGGATAPPNASLHAHCVRSTPRGVEVVGSSGGVQPLHCSVSDLLQFSYTLSGDRGAYLQLVGRDGAGQIFTYLPRDEAQQSVPVPPSAREEPLSASIRLSVRHRPGPLEVVAAISAQPLQPHVARRAAVEGAAAPPGVVLLRLPIQIEP